MLRADMDGLPVAEDSGLDYESKARQVDITGIEQPVMHACGHDVHITAMVGTARQLVERRDEWSGTLVLIGQPAEERISGAPAMLNDGLYERFPKPEYALTFHVDADRPSGKIEVPITMVGSSSDSVDITVHGVGTHGASPLISTTISVFSASAAGVQRVAKSMALSAHTKRKLVILRGPVEGLSSLNLYAIIRRIYPHLEQ